MSTPQFPPNPFTDIVPRRGSTSSKAGLDTYRRLASAEQAIQTNSNVDTDSLNMYRAMGSSVLAYAYDPGDITSDTTYHASGMTSGTIYMSAVYLPTPATITGVLSYTIVAGVGTWTIGKAAVFDSSGTRLAISANLTSLWKTTGLNQIPVTGTTALDRGLYYVGILNVRSATTTAQTIATRSSYVDLQNLLTNANYPRAVAFGSQTDIAGSYTLSTGIVANNHRWLGLY